MLFYVSPLKFTAFSIKIRISHFTTIPCAAHPPQQLSTHRRVATATQRNAIHIRHTTLQSRQAATLQFGGTLFYQIHSCLWHLTAKQKIPCKSETCRGFGVPGPGIEPGWIAPTVFETVASTDSAIRADRQDVLRLWRGRFCCGKVNVFFTISQPAFVSFKRKSNPSTCRDVPLARETGVGQLCGVSGLFHVPKARPYKQGAHLPAQWLISIHRNFGLRQIIQAWGLRRPPK